MPKLPRPKRRPRVLAIAATACALLLAGAWMATFWWTPSYSTGPRPGGLIYFGLGPSAVLWERHPGVTSVVYTWPNVGRRLRLMAWLPRWGSVSNGGYRVVLPIWIPTAASLLAAATLWRIDILHRRRLRTNLCPTCTYDRTGLPAASPCPECGAVPAPSAAASR